MRRAGPSWGSQPTTPFVRRASQASQPPLRVIKVGSQSRCGSAAEEPMVCRLTAGAKEARTIGPSRATSIRKRRQSFVRKVSRDACAPVKCAGGTAILTIEWLDGDQCHARTLYRNLTRLE